MTSRSEAYVPALDRAVTHTHRWLASLPDRQVGPRLSADDLAVRLADGFPMGAATRRKCPARQSLTLMAA